MSIQFAVSGGGWRTHSAASAVFSSALEAARDKGLLEYNQGLEALLANASSSDNTWTGVSGGSWFLNMLAYSPDFQKDLERRPEKWFESGYMGQQKEAIRKKYSDATWDDVAAKVKQLLKPVVEQAVAMAIERSEITKEILGLKNPAQELKDNVLDKVEPYYGVVSDLLKDNQMFTPDIAMLALDSDLKWEKFLKKSVFDSYQLKDTFGAKSTQEPRNNWAKDVQLINAASFDTGLTAARNRFGNSGFTPKGSSAGDTYRYWNYSNSNPSDNAFIKPIAFIDNPTGQEDKAIVFNPGNLESAKARANDRSHQYELKASYNLDVDLGMPVAASSSFLGGLATKRNVLAVLNEFLDRDGESLVNTVAKAIEDARDTIGFGAKATIGSPYRFARNLANEIRELAPSFLGGLATSGYLDQGQITDTYDNEETLNAHSFIDGAYVDNTGAGASLGTYQQVHGVKDRVKLTLFVNGSQETKGMPTELDSLFGKIGGDTLIEHPDLSERTDTTYQASPVIFNDAAIGKISNPIWQEERGDTKASVFKGEVTTINNKEFNIKGGQKVDLTVISVANKQFPGPLKKEDWNNYEKLYNDTRELMLNKGGGSYVLDALGLTQKVPANSQLIAPQEKILDHSGTLEAERVVPSEKIALEAQEREPDKTSRRSSIFRSRGSRARFFNYSNSTIKGYTRLEASDLIIGSYDRNNDDEPKRNHREILFKINPIEHSDEITGYETGKNYDISVELYVDPKGKGKSDQRYLGWFAFHNPDTAFGDPYMETDLSGNAYGWGRGGNKERYYHSDFLDHSNQTVISPRPAEAIPPMFDLKTYAPPTRGGNYGWDLNILAV